MRLSHRQDMYAVSPLAAELGIERRANALYATWAPDLRYTVDSYLGYDTFSDGNDRWEVSLAPRRAFVRNQLLNLDLGISGRWYGFDEDPGHGYYAPSLYQRYALTAFTYWKISDDDGVSVAFSYGPYKGQLHVRLQFRRRHRGRRLLRHLSRLVSQREGRRVPLRRRRHRRL